MLEMLFTSRVRVRILTLFLLEPGREFFLREICRSTDENINAVRRELANLEDMGLLSSEKRGNMKFFKINTDFTLFPELRNIILKTEGISKILKEYLDEMDIELVFIYGSFPRGTAGPESDLDLFLIGKPDEDQLVKKLWEMEKVISRDINYVLYNRHDFEEKVKERDSFICNVLNEPKIMIKGNVNDYGT